MKAHRLSRYWILAALCVLGLSGLSPALAQFPPPPGQSRQDPAFPAPPGATRAAQDPAFPPVPGQPSAPRQDPAFPPVPRAGTAQGGFSAPVSGGSFAGPAQGGFSGAPQQVPEAQKVCMDFPALREEVEKIGAKIKTASEHKAPREEVCPLFKSIVVKEDKMLKFLIKHQKTCGVPPAAITQVKTNHAQVLKIRNIVCSAAPAGPAAAPTLSDALGGPIIADDESAKKPGRGTFDTLTGNALAR